MCMYLNYERFNNKITNHRHFKGKNERCLKTNKTEYKLYNTDLKIIEQITPKY